MNNEFDDAKSALAAMMNDPNYLKMLLGLAVSQLPNGLEVGYDDYVSLLGQALVLSAGSTPDHFKLVVKKAVPTEMPTFPGTVGQA